MAPLSAPSPVLSGHFRTSRREVRKRPARPAAFGHDAAMKAADYVRLALLAAIWGGAFVFLRVAAPALGAAWTAEIRVLLGGLALLLWYRLRGVDVGLRRHARSYLILGAAIIAL